MFQASMFTNDIEEQCEQALNAIQAKEVGLNLLQRLEKIEDNYKVYAGAAVKLATQSQQIQTLEESLKFAKAERDFAVDLVIKVAEELQRPLQDRRLLLNQIRSNLSKIQLQKSEVYQLNSLRANPDPLPKAKYEMATQTALVPLSVEACVGELSLLPPPMVSRSYCTSYRTSRCNSQE